MKKILFAFAALAAMVSCSNDELVELNQQAIAFGDTFVDNATRADADDPSYGADKAVTAFKVWGTVTGTTDPVQIFNGDVVTSPTNALTDYGKVWNCNNVQYWVPNATYNFAAIVDGEATDTTTLPATIPFTADGATDLLYAEATVETDEAAVPKEGGNFIEVDGNPVVSFTFSHLLSKAKFSVKNTSATEGNNYKYKVTNITITNAYASGTYNVASKAWSGQATGSNGAYNQFGAIEVAAGETNECETEKLLIPGLERVDVSFTLELYYGTTLVSTVSKAATANITDGMLAAHAYDFNLSVSVGGQIDFTITDVNEWDTDLNDNDTADDDISLTI